MNDREKIQRRTTRERPTEFASRDENENPVIEGYFAVYNSIYEIAPGMSESIAPGAFSESLSGDVRALVNHDTTKVTGRTTNRTLVLRDDEHGLWAHIDVNPKDTDAMNAHARVERRDVTQCSIGFDIIQEDTEIRDDGSVHWTIRKARLHEVSICTFPAYKETNITARAEQRDHIRQRSLDAWKTKMKGRVKHGTEGTAPQEED